ncbi:hypothetical protein KY360_00145 [Candidatus Woesearchaeota archaeon]|nr:hypothetical protein [Candidatus Woesearchaeota archaeon]
MKEQILNKLGNINDYDSFEEVYTIFRNIELMLKLKKKGFKSENKFAGYKAS